MIEAFAKTWANLLTSCVLVHKIFVALTASRVTRYEYPPVFIDVSGALFFNMSFTRKLIQDAKAGHFTAVYLVLELIAVGITVALLIT